MAESTPSLGDVKPATPDQAAQSPQVPETRPSTQGGSKSNVRRFMERGAAAAIVAGSLFAATDQGPIHPGPAFAEPQAQGGAPGNPPDKPELTPTVTPTKTPVPPLLATAQAKLAESQATATMVSQVRSVAEAAATAQAGTQQEKDKIDVLLGTPTRTPTPDATATRVAAIKAQDARIAEQDAAAAIKKQPTKTNEQIEAEKVIEKEKELADAEEAAKKRTVAEELQRQINAAKGTPVPGVNVPATPPPDSSGGILGYGTGVDIAAGTAGAGVVDALLFKGKGRTGVWNGLKGLWGAVRRGRGGRGPRPGGTPSGAAAATPRTRRGP